MSPKNHNLIKAMIPLKLMLNILLCWKLEHNKSSFSVTVKEVLEVLTVSANVRKSFSLTYTNGLITRKSRSL